MALGVVTWMGPPWPCWSAFSVSLNQSSVILKYGSMLS